MICRSCKKKLSRLTCDQCKFNNGIVIKCPSCKTKMNIGDTNCKNCNREITDEAVKGIAKKKIWIYFIAFLVVQLLAEFLLHQFEYEFYKKAFEDIEQYSILVIFVFFVRLADIIVHVWIFVLPMLISYILTLCKIFKYSKIIMYLKPNKKPFGFFIKLLLFFVIAIVLWLIILLFNAIFGLIY